MRYPFLASCTLLCVLISACGGDDEPTDTGTSDTGPADTGSADTGSADTGSTDTGSADTGPTDCVTDGNSNLEGVSIGFPTQSCVFTLAQAAAGIELRYEVEVVSDRPGIIPRPQDAGRCADPGPSGLFLFERIDGGSESYCICDTGLCMEPAMTPVTIAAGTTPGVMSWAGVNWSGPSDTGNPVGAPFPAGTYTVTVSAEGLQPAGDGTEPYRVEGTLEITLIE